MAYSLATAMRASIGSIRFLLSKRSIPTWKGVITYVLAHVLVFSTAFQNINSNPVTLPNIIILTIVLQPGRPVGEVVLGCFLATCGILLGSLFFFILAHMGHVIPAQAIVFAVMMYPLAYIKAISLRYFAFSLLALLMSFMGIVSTVNNNGIYDPTWHKGITETYLWSVVIVQAVNVCVFPSSSERELRTTLVASLSHVRSLVPLLQKTHITQLTEEEKNERTQLIQALRMDFGLLEMAMVGTTIEVRWSRWSLGDYRKVLGSFKSMQEALISWNAGLVQAEDDLSLAQFRSEYLPESIESMKQGTRDTCSLVEEIMKELSTKVLTFEEVIDSEKTHDVERQQTRPSTEPESDLVSPTSAVSKELVTPLEVSSSKGMPFPDSISSTDAYLSVVDNLSYEPARDNKDGRSLSHGLERHIAALGAKQIALAACLYDSQTSGARSSQDSRAPPVPRSNYFNVPVIRHPLQGQSASTGNLVERERLQTSGSRTFLHPGNEGSSGSRRVPSYQTLAGSTSGEGSRVRRTISTKTQTLFGGADEDPESDVTVDYEEDEPCTASARAAVQSYSMLFSMSRFNTELLRLHSGITHTEQGTLRRNRLQIRLWQYLALMYDQAKEDWNMEENFSSAQALAAIGGNATVQAKRSLMQLVLTADQWLRSPASTYAFRVALTTVIYASFIWAPIISPFFVSYGMTGPIIDLVLVITPTFGECIMSIVFQMSSGLMGYIAGMVILQIFIGVGGYGFNPYGVVCLMGVLSIPYMFLAHERLEYFLIGLLTLNFAGVLVCTEYILVVYYELQYTRPPLLTGMVIGALAIALTLGFLIQLLVLRNSARRTLRRALTGLVESYLGYVTSLQAYCNAMQSIDPDDGPPQAAVAVVERDLKRKEAQLQSQINSIYPLLVYAAAEPRWDAPFPGNSAQELLQANQVLLDRFSEARFAIGSEPFHPRLSRELAPAMLPHMSARWKVGVSTSLYLSTSSLASNTPPPAGALNLGKLASGKVRDGLLLSARFAKTEEGQTSIKSGEFMRYWAFILAATAATNQIEAIENACRDIHVPVDKAAS